MAEDFLSAYLARIGYAGEAAPTLENITAIHAHHIRAIPFENLSPATGTAVDISPEGIEAALVRRSRGGYCFQHGGLLSRALTELGAEGVENHLGRVYWQREPGTGAPARTHQATVFTHDGARYLLDAGFGGFNPSGALPIDPEARGTEVVTPLGTFRVVDVPAAGLPQGDTATIDLMVQARIGNAWTNLYGVDLRPNAPSDFAVANWFVSTSSIPPFTRSLMFAITTPTQRLTLANLALSVRTYAADGSSTVEKHTLGSPDELREAARGLFRIEDDSLDWARAYRVASSA
ncbi:arylamine N-acetyltransferase family protein [Sinomonas notoginsengisoli]|uniref:arylamine N-acetyltransferase family protein n=1 Tax=Sinomonas notoginsengisoli TaxID=1457311 RepID=UPI001F3537FB|nr:arylamine N-acetyltransferase [Sinomonas notoginsengisoli]